MKATTLAVFLVVVVGIVVANPWNERRGRVAHHESHHNDGEGFYVDARTRPVSPPRSANSVAASSHYFFRSPRYVSSQDDDEYLPVGGRRFRVYRKNLRQEESEEEEDDVADDDDDDQDDDEPENEQFDVPTWEKMFPREEQGSQGQDLGPPPSGGGYGGGQQGGSGPPPSGGGYGGRPQGGQPSGGQYGGGQQGGSGPPPSGGGYGSSQQGGGDRYELVSLPGGQGGPSFGGGSGRSGMGQQVRPVTVRIVRPRQYSGVPVSKKSWAVQEPQVYGRQYHGGRRNSRPQPYQYVYAQPQVSRRWAYQPVQQMSQYAYQPRPVYRRSSNGGNVWARQQRSNKHH